MPTDDKDASLRKAIKLGLLGAGTAALYFTVPDIESFPDAFNKLSIVFLFFYFWFIVKRVQIYKTKAYIK